MRTDYTHADNRPATAIWGDLCSRIAELIDGLPEEAATTPVPTVPGTSVADVLAHMGVTASLGAAPEESPYRPPRAGTAGTARLATLVTRWRDAASGITGRLDTDGPLSTFLITDTVMAEHDLRAALEKPDARDDIAIRVALDELAHRFSDRVAAAGLPALRVTVEQWGTIAGNGNAVRCVVADRFEFVRGMAGRRSASEIRRWNWGVAPDRYLAVISESALPEQEIRERDPRIPAHMRDREFVL